MTNSRNTEQRKKILEYLKSVNNHPTAETVYKEIKKDMLKITLATIYRNLNLLAKEGKILRLEVNKEYHYDACCSDHQHCICEKCGEITETFNEKITKYVMKNLKKPDFKPASVNIIFEGCCKSCNH